MTLTFITSNPAKAEQLGRHLDLPVLHQKIDLPEIQSLNLRDIVEHKAREAFKHTNTPVLVEDTSLVFHALGGLPGPLIKWFLKELDNKGLCSLLDAFDDRSATAKVLFGLYDGGEEVLMFEGETEGSIAKLPKGEQGFGWDPVFIPQGCGKAWGEMTKEEQQETSMRRKALKKLQGYIENNSGA